LCGTDFYAKRGDWLETISKYFAMWSSQKVELLAVQVTPLAADLTVMTSQDYGEFGIDGKIVDNKHIFTVIWEKEAAGWPIIHSHESWIGL